MRIPLHFLYGFRKPVVFFPQYILRNWPEREQLAVIAHELAHVRRYDMIAHHGMRLLRILLWFWPPVWWMQKELHRTQDTACDECAAVVLGNNIEFGKALTELAGYCLISNPAFPALGILHAKPSLLLRMENIMNMQLVHLSRLSLRFKFGLMAIFCILFLGLGTVKQTVFAQALNIQYLGNYKGDKNALGIEKMVYAEPYYLMIGRQGDNRVIQFYRFDNGELKLEKIEYLDKVMPHNPDASLGAAYSQNGYLVLFYQNSREYVIWKYADPASPMQMGISLFDSAAQIVIDDHFLYMLSKKIVDTNESWFIARWDLSSTDYKEYAVPAKITPSCLALFQGDVILNDRGYISSDPDDQPGLIRGQLSGDGKVVVGQKRWFAQTSATEMVPFESFKFLYAKYPYLIYEKKTLDPYNGSETYSFSIVDWSDKENPVTVQTIPCESGSVLQYDNRFVIGTTMYTLNKNLFEKNGSVALSGYGQMMGPELISFSDRKLYQYDPAHLDQMKLVVIPSTISPSYLSICPAGNYVYQSSANSGSMDIYVYDAAIPADMKMVQKLNFPGKMARAMQVHNGLLSMVLDVQGKPDTILYPVNNDGLIGNRIDAPARIDYSTNVILGENLYNDKLYIQSNQYPVPNGMETPDPTYHRLFVYERDGGMIKPTTVSDFALDVKDRIIALTDKYLFSVNMVERKKVIDGFDRMVLQNILNIYSLENPSRPSLVNKIDVISKTNSNLIVRMVSSGNVVAYYDAVNIGLIDLRDPAQPKYRYLDIPGNPPVTSLSFVKNVLFVGTSKALLIYEIGEAGADREIGRIDMVQSQPKIEGNRIYNAKGNLGIDTYSFSFANVGLFDWKKY